MSVRPINQMWIDAFELLSEAERLQRQFFRPLPNGAKPTWEPPIDVYETETFLSITVALPGVEPERIEVYLNGGSLLVSGHRPAPCTSRAAYIHRMEIPYGRFERRIGLPKTHQYELASYHCQHGCLQLNLRKW